VTNDAASLADLGGNGFRALTELAPDFIAVLDLNGVIRYASPSVKRVMGYLPAEVVGRPFLELINPGNCSPPRAPASLGERLTS
jgi:PAS domain S-box-containing protein